MFPVSKFDQNIKTVYTIKVNHKHYLLRLKKLCLLKITQGIIDRGLTPVSDKLPQNNQLKGIEWSMGPITGQLNNPLSF